MNAPFAWLATTLTRRRPRLHRPKTSAPGQHLNADAWLVLPTVEKRRLIQEFFAQPQRSDFDPLQLVAAPENLGIFASIGQQYRFAVFGRDSIETAEDILDSHPELVREIILILCRLQLLEDGPLGLVKTSCSAIQSGAS